MITLDGNSLTLEDLASIADEHAPVALDARAAAAVDAARAVVDRHAGGDAPVYGLNTGFGSLSEVEIPATALDALQRNLLRSHAPAVREPLPALAVHPMTALPPNVLPKPYPPFPPPTLPRLL